MTSQLKDVLNDLRAKSKGNDPERVHPFVAGSSNAFSVRSSLTNKLSLTEENPFPTTAQTDGLAENMLDAVESLDAPVTLARILYWHSRLFPEGNTQFNPVAGG